MENHEWKIQEQDNQIYKIIFYLPSKLLIKSIVKTNIVLGSTVINNYKEIQLKATSIKSFQQFKKEQGILTFPIIVAMIRTLTTQLSYLIKNKKTFIGYHPERIIVIDNNKFLFITNEFLLDIVDYDKAFITFPFFKDIKQKEFYIAPELISLKELPAKLDYKLIYYSFGCLMTYCLTEDIPFEEQETGLEEVNDILDKSYIKGTKIYWLLKRCLQLDSQKRSIIFI